MVQSNFDKIQLGMTSDEVIEILGNPGKDNVEIIGIDPEYKDRDPQGLVVEWTYGSFVLEFRLASNENERLPMEAYIVQRMDTHGNSNAG